MTHQRCVAVSPETLSSVSSIFQYLLKIFPHAKIHSNTLFQRAVTFVNLTNLCILCVSMAEIYGASKVLRLDVVRWDSSSDVALLYHTQHSPKKNNSLASSL